MVMMMMTMTTKKSATRRVGRSAPPTVTVAAVADGLRGRPRGEDGRVLAGRAGRVHRHRSAGAGRLRVVRRRRRRPHLAGVRARRGDDRLDDRARQRRPHQPGRHRRLPVHAQDQLRSVIAKLHAGAFQFAILIDSIRYANRFGSENRIKSNRNFFCPNWNALLHTGRTRPDRVRGLRRRPGYARVRDEVRGLFVVGSGRVRSGRARVVEFGYNGDFIPSINRAFADIKHVSLPAFAAAAPSVLQSIDVSYTPGPQQQTG